MRHHIETEMLIHFIMSHRIQTRPLRPFCFLVPVDTGCFWYWSIISAWQTMGSHFLLTVFIICVQVSVANWWVLYCISNNTVLIKMLIYDVNLITNVSLINKIKVMFAIKLYETSHYRYFRSDYQKCTCQIDVSGNSNSRYLKLHSDN